MRLTTQMQEDLNQQQASYNDAIRDILVALLDLIPADNPKRNSTVVLILTKLGFSDEAIVDWFAAR